MEDLEEYKRKLKERIAREVVPILFPPPSPRELFAFNLSPPLPPQLLERLERPYNRSEAKRYVLEALNYIRENKEVVENDVKKRLKPPIYLIPSEEPPEDLEENYIAVLKEWAREKVKELKELSEASKRAAESMKKELREKHPEWEDLRREFLGKIGPLALILPPQVLKALKEHDLLDDEEVNEALRKVNETMLKPIPVAIAEHIVESIPEWYLKALYESKKKEKEFRGTGEIRKEVFRAVKEVFEGFPSKSHFGLLKYLEDEEHARILLPLLSYYAFEKGDRRALLLLNFSLNDKPDLRPLVKRILSENAEKLVYLAYKKGIREAQSLVESFLELLNGARYLALPVTRYALEEDNWWAKTTLYHMIRKMPSTHTHIVRALELLGGDKALKLADDLFIAKDLIKFFYSNRKHLPEASELIERVMRNIYVERYGKEPPKPAHPGELPVRVEHPAFRNTRDLRGVSSTEVPESLLKELNSLGIAVNSIYDLHNVLDRLKNHRKELIENLTKDLPPEEKEKKARELEEKINGLIPQLEEVTKKIGTKRIILDFRLEAVPKKASEWVEARIRASNDCTVPEGPAFKGHTVPTYFSSSATVYKIVASHLETKKKKDEEGRVKRVKLYVRKNKHVGNVYVAVHTTEDGRKILYVHGVQLGNIYRGAENAGIARGLLKGIVDVAKNNGFDEIWIQTRDLSNFGALAEALKDEFKKMGAKLVSGEELKKLRYGDLPKHYYASPHDVGENRLYKLELKK